MRSTLTRRLSAMEQLEQVRQQAECDRYAVLWAPFWAAFSPDDIALLATHPAHPGNGDPVPAAELTAEHWRVADLWYQRLYALFCAVRPFFAGAVPQTYAERQDLARFHDYLDSWAADIRQGCQASPIELLTWLDTAIAELDPSLPIAVRAYGLTTEGVCDAPESV